MLEDSDNEKKFADLVKDGIVQFNSKYKAKEFIGKIESVLDKSIRYQIEDTKEEVTQEILTFIPKVNQEIERELGQLLEEITKRMGKNIDINLPVVKFDNSGFSIENELEKSIQTDSEDVKKTYFGSSFMRTIDFFDNKWGYDEKDIYIIKKDDIVKNIESTFNKLLQYIENNVENLYDQEITPRIKNAIEQLINTIEEYRGEMEIVLKKRKNNDQKDIDDEIKNVRKYEKETQKLSNRIKRSKKILGTSNECK